MFDVWTSYFGIMGQYDPTFDLKINVVYVTYISWSSDFVLYLHDCLIQIMRQCDPNFDIKVNVSQHYLY